MSRRPSSGGELRPREKGRKKAKSNPVGHHEGGRPRRKAVFMPAVEPKKRQRIPGQEKERPAPGTFIAGEEEPISPHFTKKLDMGKEMKKKRRWRLRT